jgi:fatty-acid desaturase
MSTAVLEVDGNMNDPAAMPGLDLEAAGSIAQLVSPGTSSSAEQLARTLWVVSYATLFVGANAGLHRPAARGSVFARHEVAYYGIVAAVLAAVPVEMATAFWLHGSSGRSFHAFARVLKRVAVLLLLFVSALGGIELTLKV